MTSRVVTPMHDKCTNPDKHTTKPRQRHPKQWRLGTTLAHSERNPEDDVKQERAGAATGRETQPSERINQPRRRPNPLNPPGGGRREDGRRTTDLGRRNEEGERSTDQEARGRQGRGTGGEGGEREDMHKQHNRPET